MGLAATEQELELKASRFVKAELKLAGLTYADLAERLKDHGLPAETESSIKAKLRAALLRQYFYWLRSRH